MWTVSIIQFSEQNTSVVCTRFLCILQMTVWWLFVQQCSLICHLFYCNAYIGFTSTLVMYGLASIDWAIIMNITRYHTAQKQTVKSMIVQLVDIGLQSVTVSQPGQSSLGLSSVPLGSLTHSFPHFMFYSAWQLPWRGVVMCYKVRLLESWNHDIELHSWWQLTRKMLKVFVCGQ